jgi:hypothetical protein
MFLPLVVLVATAAVVSAGIYLTLRGFRASEARANGAAANGAHGPHGNDAAAPHHHVSRHDQATNDQLKRYFDGKACAICGKTIPPVHRTGLKPGLLDPATHDTQSWDEIPNGGVAAAIEHRKPLCPSCVVAESFRHRFADRVVDRDLATRA